MGQHLSSINSQIINLTKSDHSTLSHTSIVSIIGPEDISLLSSNTQLSRQWIKQIQNYLYLLSNIPEFEIINAQIDNIFITITTEDKRLIQEINNTFEKQQQLKISFTNRLNDCTEQYYLSKFTSPMTVKHSERQLEKSLHDLLSSNISFKGILSVLNQLIFDTIHTYDVRNIFLKLYIQMRILIE
jgi:hypothetical protein